MLPDSTPRNDIPIPASAASLINSGFFDVTSARIIEEMKRAKRAGYTWIFFTDYIFIVFPNVKQREELFKRIIEEKIDMKWIVQMRADVTSKKS